MSPIGLFRNFVTNSSLDLDQQRQYVLFIHITQDFQISTLYSPGVADLRHTFQSWHVDHISVKRQKIEFIKIFIKIKVWIIIFIKQ